jgi:hypothetical protein
VRAAQRLGCRNVPALRKERQIMRKSDIDHMLEVAVAKALGVKLPHLRTAARPTRKPVHAHRPVRRAA